MYKAMSDFDLDAEKHSPASSVQSTKRLRSCASSEADCECPLYEKRASAAGNKSEIQAALSGTDHTEKAG